MEERLSDNGGLLQGSPWVLALQDNSIHCGDSSARITRFGLSSSNRPNDSPPRKATSQIGSAFEHDCEAFRIQFMGSSSNIPPGRVKRGGDASHNRRLAPEEVELRQKRSQLTALETQLAERELELTVVVSELAKFERYYLGIVGPLYSELDGLTDHSSATECGLDSTDDESWAQETDAQARDTPHGTIRVRPDHEKHPPTAALLSIYRQVARALHPDLACDAQDRDERTRLMADANAAYSEGDEAHLQSMLKGWLDRPECVAGEGIGAELIRAIRRIAQIRERLKVISGEVADLQSSDLWEMKANAELAQSEGRNILVELVARLQQEIVETRDRLQTMKTGRR